MNDTGLELFAIGLGIVSLILFVLTVSNRVTFFSSNTDFSCIGWLNARVF